MSGPEGGKIGGERKERIAELGEGRIVVEVEAAGNKGVTVDSGKDEDVISLPNRVVTSPVVVVVGSISTLSTFPTPPILNAFLSDFSVIPTGSPVMNNLFEQVSSPWGRA